MTYRQFWATVIIVGVVTIGSQVAGGQVLTFYFVGIGLIGLAGSAWYFIRRAQLVRRLRPHDADSKDRVLVWLENEVVRPEIASILQRPQPRGPLRSATETFRYPADSAQTSEWVSRGSFFLAALIGIGTLSDRYMGRTTFSDPAVTPYWETSFLVLCFLAMGVAMAWMARESKGVLDVTDEGVTWTVPGRRRKTISWDQVTLVRRGDLSRRLIIKSAQTTIAVSDVLTGYGRLVNIVATRVPTSAGRQLTNG